MICSSVDSLARVAVAATLSMAMLNANAQTTVPFDLPAQSLVESLRAVGDLTDTNILIDRSLVGELQAPALSAQLTANDAITALLAGSGLQHRFIDDHTVVLSRIDTTAVPGGQPMGAAETHAGLWRTLSLSTLMLAFLNPQNAYTAEVDDELAQNTIVVTGTTIEDPILSSRTGDTVRERPQSVTVISRELLDQQNLNSVAAALDQTTGITVSTVSFSTTQFYSRGLEINTVQLDGSAPFVFNDFGYNQLPDLAIYEQVEVMRGADALFSGNGEAGGTIQLVRKRPTETAQIQFAASAGSWSNYRGELDAAGPLGFDGRVRGRMVYVTEDSDSYLKNGQSNRDLVFGIIEADVAEQTKVTFGGTHDSRDTPYGGLGLPRYSDGGDLRLPRSTSLVPDWARFKARTNDLFARVDQQFGSDWNLRVNATRTKQQMTNMREFVYSPVDRETGLIGAMYGTEEHITPVQTLFDVTIKGQFELFGRKHKVALGTDWQDIESDGPVWVYPTVNSIDPFNFDPGSIGQPALSAIPSRNSTSSQRQTGIYGSVNLAITDALRVVGGARYSNYEYKWGLDFLDTTGGVTSSLRTEFEDRGVLTPYAGFTYTINRDWSAYGSFAESYRSQATYLQGPADAPSPLDPVVGESLELGIKGGLGDGRAATQIAVYRIQRKNDAVLDFYEGDGLNGSSCCYLGNGVVESRGLDVEVNGQLTRQWNLFAGYTYNENEYKSGYTSGQGTTYMPKTPKHLLKVWTNYELPGSLSQWQVGAGVNVQSSNYVSGSASVLDPDTGGFVSIPYRFAQGGYAVANARVQYEINDHWTASLNVTNLFDKTYYQTVGTSLYANWYGQPRAFMAVVRAKW
ncbi:TonB-dependent siderophore receptor [Steroidobacter sp.]|uniref:TonB-dependent siderophore receptor n=1 Tax=Steroidobacter sp. TaxID=1978227 RepID=UPI0025F58B97|nr:TonB-dependent receptor [Steroidobacter sp.]